MFYRRNEPPDFVFSLAFFLILVGVSIYFFVALVSGVVGFILLSSGPAVAYALLPERRRVQAIENWLVQPDRERAQTGLPSEEPIKPVILKGLSWDNLILPDNTLRQIQTTLNVLTDPKAKQMVASPPKGMLLYGPPGTGKTQIARVIASVGKFNFFQLGTAEARGEFIGQGANRIKKVFEAARRRQPAILFIDEIDAIASSRDSLQGGGSSSAFFTDAVNELLQQMDGLDKSQLFVVAATNRIEVIDPAVLRRLGVDPETKQWAVEIPLPDESCRVRLLQLFLKEITLAGDVEISQIARQTNGFSGDSLRTLCSQAGLKALSNNRQHVTQEDFREALNKNPNVGTQVKTVKVSNLEWDHLILPESTIKQIQTTLNVITDPEAAKLVASPPRGMLLYGPPGTGKTQIARVVASVGKFNFYTLGTAEARGQYVGQGAAKIKEVFDTARKNLPSIVFIDEIDAIATNRESLHGGGSASAFFADAVNELLQQMDGLDARQVFVIAATNRLDVIDPAVLRRLGVDPKTYQWAIEIPLPDQQNRVRLLQLFLKEVVLDDDLNISIIAERTEGFSGDSLRTLCSQSGMKALMNGRKSVSHQDFMEAMSNV